MENLVKNLPPHKILKIKNVVSQTGTRIGGIGIMCPYTPKHMFTLEERVVIDKIVSSVKLAQSLGAKIVGLGGFTSIVGDEGDKVAKEVDIGVTSGNTYTAALALQGINKAAELLEKNLEDSTLAVIGATGDIGSICSKILAKRVKTIILCARRIEEATDFIQEIKKNSNNVLIEKYPEKAAEMADFILSATSAATTIIEPEHLKKGAVVCDVSVPPNIAREVAQIRDDVFVFEGGKARFSNYQSIRDKHWQRIFPDGSIYGCLAETMILSFEGLFEDFSVGRGNITEERIDFISHLAERHGFELAPFHCGDLTYTEEDIKKIKSKIN
jgi:predicted amino acid dehydrogenase